MDNETGVSTSVFFDQIIVAKTIAMLVLGLGSFMLGMLPIKLAPRKWGRPNAEAPPQPSGHSHSSHSHPGHSATDSSIIVSLLLCFGGGVLLFTTFLHLQPEVRESVNQLQLTRKLPNGHGAENLGDLIFCVGFFLVFLIDQIVHNVLDGWYDSENDAGLHRSMSLRRRNPAVTKPALQPSADSPATPHAVTERQNKVSEEKYRPIPWEMTTPTKHRDQQLQQQPQIEENNAITQPSGSLRMDETTGQSLRGLFAVLALSFHEVFEGLAIGLEERVDHMWYLFFAVATHKLIIAFCIGLELAWLDTKRAVLITYVTTFAIVTPVGITIGMVLVYYGDGGSVDGTPGLVAVVLQGLAAGTLLYVVFFEVLTRYKQSGFLHLLSIILGFCVMLGLQMMTHHSHSHSHMPDDNHQHSDHHHEFHEHEGHKHAFHIPGHEHNH
ncbi:zinc transporter ZIP1-like isoform X2 [Melanaphis sacchari]|uniref:zinc transporter ZIP1-like isoform X2 n=1 Tax=Melanaphis sacchari TaxID=742174 RepID=UPI000DC1456C|nr:zinc transporter ZIP1-like isoform X2 [Melanaphis sacchari]